MPNAVSDALATESIDPFEAHFHRDPLPNAAIDVIVIASRANAESEAIASGLGSLIRGRGRDVQTRVVVIWEGRAKAIAPALKETSAPLVLLTDATKPWQDAHLAPLLGAIDRCDHVIGRRRCSWIGAVMRWVSALPFKILFAIPARDALSPCQLHRREKLTAIPLQSCSEFLDVEILAKATFLGHLIDEAPVPAIDSLRDRGFWGDCWEVLRKPLISRPAEDPKRDVEGADRPGGQDAQGDQHAAIGEAGPLEND